MRVGIGADHGGYDLKQAILARLGELGISCTDYGTHDKSACDYPVYGRLVGRAVAKGECERGIVVCTTGIGISMAAGKVPGVRCALCHSETEARLSRLHNDANVLALGGGVTGTVAALAITETFLNTPFSGEERHRRRIAQIEGDKEEA